MSHPNQTRTEQDEEEALHYRAVLRKLVDIGMDMVADIHEQSKAPSAPNAPIPDHTVRLARMARCIRRSILLARKLAEPLPRASSGPDRTAARKRILREVEDSIHRRIKGPEAETLGAELLDRLDSPDLDDDIAHLPVSVIIADIARDLGVGSCPEDRRFGWKRRKPEDIETLAVRAATEPRSPLLHDPPRA